MSLQRTLGSWISSRLGLLRDVAEVVKEKDEDSLRAMLFLERVAINW